MSLFLLGLALSLQGCTANIISAEEESISTLYSPSLSYSQSTGATVQMNATMSVSPSVLKAGLDSTISKCGIKLGSLNASSFPSTLAVNASTCKISGTPTAGLAPTPFVIEVTNSLGVSSTAQVTLAVAGSADHLVLVSGNNQSARGGAQLDNLVVQLVDRFGTMVSSGVNVGIMRTLGFDSSPSQVTTVTTNSNGLASFSAVLGYSPSHWQIVPMGTTLPDLANSGGTKVVFTSIPKTLGNGTLQPHSTYSSGWLPAKTIVGDFNGDGKLDVANVDTWNNQVNVLIGVGNGTFPAVASYNVAANPWGLATGDYNNDGKLDIASAGSGGNISILIGVGNGTFQAAVNYAATIPSYPQVTAADFNGDGKLDLVASSSNNNLQLLLGNGNGTFQAASTINMGLSGGQIAAADLNEDGKLDIALNTNSGATVLLGNGNGTFQVPVSYAGVNGASGITVGDFNGDGKKDLATTNNASNSISVFFGNGDGTFQAQTSYGTATGGPTEAAVGDFNGDGALDISTVNWSSGSNVTVFLNNGNGTFQSGANYGVGSGPKGFAIGDVNGDGKLDIMTGNYNGHNISVLLGN